MMENWVKDTLDLYVLFPTTACESIIISNGHLIENIPEGKLFSKCQNCKDKEYQRTKQLSLGILPRPKTKGQRD